MKLLPIYFAYISGKEEFISYALTEKEAFKLASNSFWADEIKGEISVKKISTEVYELHEEFSFEENQTNHIIYTCPVCKKSYSEDIYKQETKELLVSCGNWKNHPELKEVWIHIKKKQKK